MNTEIETTDGPITNEFIWKAINVLSEFRINDYRLTTEMTSDFKYILTTMSLVHSNPIARQQLIPSIIYNIHIKKDNIEELNDLMKEIDSFFKELFVEIVKILFSSNAYIRKVTVFGEELVSDEMVDDYIFILNVVKLSLPIKEFRFIHF